MVYFVLEQQAKINGRLKVCLCRQPEDKGTITTKVYTIQQFASIIKEFHEDGI